MKKIMTVEEAIDYIDKNANATQASNGKYVYGDKLERYNFLAENKENISQFVSYDVNEAMAEMELTNVNNHYVAPKYAELYKKLLDAREKQRLEEENKKNETPEIKEPEIAEHVDTPEVVETPEAEIEAPVEEKVDTPEVAEIPEAEIEAPVEEKVDTPEVAEIPEAEIEAPVEEKVDTPEVAEIPEVEIEAPVEEKVDTSEVVEIPEAEIEAPVEEKVDTPEVAEIPEAEIEAPVEEKVDTPEVVETPEAEIEAPEETKVDTPEVAEIPEAEIEAPVEDKTEVKEEQPSIFNQPIEEENKELSIEEKYKLAEEKVDNFRLTGTFEELGSALLELQEIKKEYDKYIAENKAETEVPVVEAPAEETVEAEVPVVEAPTEETVEAEVPVVEAPTEETVEAEVPVVEAPTEETVEAEVPVVEAPAEEKASIEIEMPSIAVEPVTDINDLNDGKSDLASEPEQIVDKEPESSSDEVYEPLFDTSTDKTDEAEIYKTITPEVPVAEIAPNALNFDSIDIPVEQIPDEAVDKKEEIKEEARKFIEKTKVKTRKVFTWTNQSRKKAAAVTGLMIANVIGKRSDTFKALSKEIGDVIEFAKVNGTSAGKDELLKINQKILNLEPGSIKANEYALLLKELAKSNERLQYNEAISRI